MEPTEDEMDELLEQEVSLIDSFDCVFHSIVIHFLESLARGAACRQDFSGCESPSCEAEYSTETEGRLIRVSSSSSRLYKSIRFSRLGISFREFWRFFFNDDERIERIYDEKEIALCARPQWTEATSATAARRRRREFRTFNRNNNTTIILIATQLCVDSSLFPIARPSRRGGLCLQGLPGR
jgi:hypothetical protein